MMVKIIEEQFTSTSELQMELVKPILRYLLFLQAFCHLFAQPISLKAYLVGLAVSEAPK